MLTLALILSLFACSQASELASGPFFVTYIDRVTSWWPPTAIASSLGVPTYAPNSTYNYINLAFWTTGGPVDAALVWGNLYEYVSSDNPWGNNTQQVQAAWLKLYHAAGIKLLVSAFGATDMPTGSDPVQTANALANFVKVNQLDGCDVDYEDDDAMNEGKAENWLISFTQTLRQQLPSPQYVISHAPQAPWFMGKPQYPAGGYLTVDQQVGYAIDFYSIQFYNQVSTTYSTYNYLFVASDGWATNTAVMQIAASVTVTKLVIGKPVTTGDETSTGYIPVDTLSQYIQQAMQSTSWKAGVMGWQYASDMSNGDKWINTLSANWKK